MDVEWRRTAAYVVCRDERDRLLLTRFVSPGHPHSGRWTMPGGGMEWGETPEATASRELHEETGLTATIGSVIGVFSHWLTAQDSARGQAGQVLGVVFAATDLAGALRETFAPGTTDAARWFTIAEARDVPHVELVDFVLDRI